MPATVHALLVSRERRRERQLVDARRRAGELLAQGEQAREEARHVRAVEQGEPDAQHRLLAVAEQVGAAAAPAPRAARFLRRERGADGDRGRGAIVVLGPPMPGAAEEVTESTSTTTPRRVPGAYTPTAGNARSAASHSNADGPACRLSRGMSETMGGTLGPMSARSLSSGG